MDLNSNNKKIHPAGQAIKKGESISAFPLVFMVSQAGFEPAAYGFVVGSKPKTTGKKR